MAGSIFFRQARGRRGCSSLRERHRRSPKVGGRVLMRERLEPCRRTAYVSRVLLHKQYSHFLSGYPIYYGAVHGGLRTASEHGRVRTMSLIAFDAMV